MSSTTTDPQTRMFRIPRWLGVALLASIFLSAFANVGLNPVLPAIQQSFTDTPNAAFLTKMLVTVIGIDAIIGSPLAAWLMRPVGPRRLMVFSCVLFVVAGLAGLFLTELWMLVGSRFLVGLAASIATTVGVAVIVTTFPSEARSRWLGYLTTAGTLWAAASTFAAGQVGEAGWRMVFWLHLAAIPVLVAALLGMGEKLLSSMVPEHEDIPESGKPRASLWRHAWAPAVGVAIGFAGTATVIYSPFRLAELQVGGPAVIGNLLLGFSLAAAVAAFLYGRLRRWTSVTGSFVLAFALMAVGFVVFQAIGTFAGLLVALLITGFGNGLLQPNVYGMIADTGDLATRTRLVGLVKAGYFSGPLIGQFVVTAFAGNDPASTIRFLNLFFAVALVAALVAGAVMRSRRSAVSESVS